MSDEDEAPSLLLHGSADTGDDTNVILLGALAAAGVGFLLWKKKKKEEEDESPKKKKKSAAKELPTPEANQVIFNADMSAYEIGPSWFVTVLEPYLEEKVEEMILATPEWKTKGPIGWGMTEASLAASINASRQKVLSAFHIITFVRVGTSQKTIAALPDTEAVRQFKSVIDSYTKNFQEEY